MSAVAYTVIATFSNEDVRREYIEWLESGHIDAVVRGGAHAAAIVRIDDPSTPLEVQTRYIFQTRQALDRYLEHVAPSLRADGIAKFPPERGVQMRRQIGTVL
jgi:hypothetical protein